MGKGLVDGLFEQKQHFLVVEDHVDDGESLLRTRDEVRRIEDGASLHHVAQIDLEQTKALHLSLSQEGVVTFLADLAEETLH